MLDSVQDAMALWRISIYSSCGEDVSSNYSLAISKSMSCWEDKDGLSDASVYVLLFFGGGRAEGSLTTTSLPLTSLLTGNF